MNHDAGLPVEVNADGAHVWTILVATPTMIAIACCYLGQDGS